MGRRRQHHDRRRLHLPVRRVADGRCAERDLWSPGEEPASSCTAPVGSAAGLLDGIPKTIMDPCPKLKSARAQQPTPGACRAVVVALKPMGG